MGPCNGLVDQILLKLLAAFSVVVLLVGMAVCKGNDESCQDPARINDPAPQGSGFPPPVVGAVVAKGYEYGQGTAQDGCYRKGKRQVRESFPVKEIDYQGHAQGKGQLGPYVPDDPERIEISFCDHVKIRVG